MKTNTWRPNQSGTFSNRVNIHDTYDSKLFVIEFHDKITESSERIKIVNTICSSPELLKWCLWLRDEALKDDPEFNQPELNKLLDQFI